MLAVTNSRTSSALNPGRLILVNVGTRAKPTEGIGQWMLARQFGTAVGADQQQPAVRHFRREEFKQAQRRGVGPMQIIEHQDVRPASAQRREE